VLTHIKNDSYQPALEEIKAILHHKDKIKIRSNHNKKIVVENIVAIKEGISDIILNSDVVYRYKNKQEERAVFNRRKVLNKIIRRKPRKFLYYL
jgi:hypothetical protein